MKRDVVGVLLAAGFGSRLRPSTLVCPKPLIPVAGLEPLFHAIESFQDIGVKKIVVNTHYLSNEIIKSVDEWKSFFPEIEFRISFEEKILGTGGAILKIISENEDWIASSRGLLLQNSDTLASFNMKPLILSENQSTLAVSSRKNFLEKYKKLVISKTNDQWLGLDKESLSVEEERVHFLGVHFLCRKDLFKLVSLSAPVKEVDLFNGIYRPLIDHDSKFIACRFFSDSEKKSSFWFDMTNEEFLLEAQRYIFNHCFRDYWLKILKKRHLHLEEVKENVWSNLSLDSFHPDSQVSGPSLLLFSEKSKNNVLLSIEENVFISLKKSDFSGKERSIEAQNAVLYSYHQEHCESVHSSFKDQVKVI